MGIYCATNEGVKGGDRLYSNNINSPLHILGMI